MKSINRFITRIQDADDANLTLTNGYMMVYDSGQGKFVTQAIPSTSPGGSAGYVQYYGSGGVLAGHSGFVYDGAGKVTLSSALVSPDVRPASNAVNSTGFSKADGTRVLSVDTTNGRVGIGTTTPISPLQVNGYITTTGFNVIDGSRQISADAGGKMRIYANGGHMFSVWNNGYVDGMIMASLTGYVAVGGVTTPTSALDIGASTTTRASLRIRSGTAPTTPNSGDLWYDGTDFYLRSTSSYSVGSVVRTTAIRPVSDSTTALQWQNAAGTAIVTVDTTNSLVGIGTTTPSNKLDVAGTVQMDGLRIDVTPTNETITCTHTITLSADGTNYKIPCAAA